jgi:hypothetical protein
MTGIKALGEIRTLLAAEVNIEDFGCSGMTFCRLYFISYICFTGFHGQEVSFRASHPSVYRL